MQSQLNCMHTIPVPKRYCTAHMPHRYIRYPYFSRQVRHLPEGATVFRAFSKNRIYKITLRIQWISLAQSNCLLFCSANQNSARTNLANSVSSLGIVKISTVQRQTLSIFVTYILVEIRGW